MFIAKFPRQKEKAKQSAPRLPLPKDFNTGDFLVVSYKINPNDKPLSFSGILVAQTKCAQYTRFTVKKMYNETSCIFSFIMQAKIVTSIEKKFEIKSRQANLFYLFEKK